MYLNNRDLYYEIVVSKALGKLTNPAQIMLELLAKRTIIKIGQKCFDNDDRLDCYQTGLLFMFSNWHNFDEDKYKNAFSYFTEIFKRGTTMQFNELYKRKGQKELFSVKSYSIESGNDGNGLYNI